MVFPAMAALPSIVSSAASAGGSSLFSSLGSSLGSLGSLASSFGLGGDDGPGFLQQYNEGTKMAAGISKAQSAGSLAGLIRVAKANGLHPLSVVGGGSSGGSGQVLYGDKSADLASLGQGVDRALNVGRSNTQRQLDKLALEKAQLSNDYLRTQIAGAQAAIANSGATPSFGNKGLSGVTSSELPVGGSERIDVIKDKQIAKDPNDSSKTAGKHAAFMTIDLGRGRTAEVPYSDESWAEAIGELPTPYKYWKMLEILYKKHDNSTPGYLLAKKYKQWKKYKKY